ncbi:MAG: DUF4368 domain-containing protein, partial [Lachnospiraceae bacterium]|nr:DUF4368 domain-containing protein [Lachnospiraceae bacterium]
KNALKELYLDKVSGNITLEDFQDFSKRFHSEIEEYEEAMQQRKETLLKMEESAEQNLTKKDILKKYSDINELNYDIMNTFIDHIEVGHRKTLQEEYPVKIFWKF